jgi:hypothetical protein
MNRPSPVIRYVVFVFFVLAVTGFVAYRSGWILQDHSNKDMDITPEIPVSSKSLSDSLTTPDTLVAPKPLVEKESAPEIKTIMEGSKSMILTKPELEEIYSLNDSIKFYLDSDTLPSIQIDSTPEKIQPMIYSSKSGMMIRPVDIKPKKPTKTKLVKHL